MNILILAQEARLALEGAAQRETVGQAGAMTFHYCLGLPDLHRQSAQSHFDLLILSLAEAGPDPVQTIQELLAHEPVRAMPILLVAARQDEPRIAAALQAGAADYALLPLRRTELLTRMRVLIKRHQPQDAAESAIGIGPFSFDPHTLHVTDEQRTVTLTRKEFELALLLFRHAGRPLSRAFMLERLWPNEGETSSRTLDTHISRVRNKLRLRPENGYRLSPVYSFGYQLEILPARRHAFTTDDAIPS